MQKQINCLNLKTQNNISDRKIEIHDHYKILFKKWIIPAIYNF